MKSVDTFSYILLGIGCGLIFAGVTFAIVWTLIG